MPYDVENEEIRNLLLSIGRKLKKGMPEGWGFCLNVFSYGEQGASFYLSTARRTDTIQLLKELVTRLEGETDEVD